MIRKQDICPCTVTVEQAPAAIIYINSTKRKLEALLGDDYTVQHNGDLSWTIRPKIKHIDIDFKFDMGKGNE